MRTIVFAKCDKCHREFSYEKHGRPRRFCSTGCSQLFIGHSRRRRVKKQCTVCEKQYETWFCRKDTSLYCSRACQNIDLGRKNSGSNHRLWKGGKAKSSCQLCHTEFIAKRVDVERGRARFCSRKCKGAWMTQNLVGKFHPHWKGGRKPYPEGWNESLKEIIRERDQRKCALCGVLETPYKHAVHHIDRIKENIDPENLITLCRSCHSKAHHRQKHFLQSLFVSMISRRVLVYGDSA